MGGNKYGAKKIKDPATGFVFDSKKEFIRWCELRILEKSGNISDLKRQVKYELIPKQEGERACSYIADFTYVADFVYKVPTQKWEEISNGWRLVDGWETVVEDTKGVRTDAYRIKRKLMLHIHGIRIKET